MTGPKLILIVEDNPLIAMDLEDELHDRGYRCSTAKTSAGAHSEIDKEAPGMAILDIHLVSETTFDLARELRRRGVPFAFLSGNDVSSLPDDLSKQLVLTKPVRMDDLVKVIDAGLGQGTI